MKESFLQPGDIVRLHNGQCHEVLKQEGNIVKLVMGEEIDCLHVYLLVMRPVHLAVHIFNINGLAGVQRWLWNSSRSLLIEHVVREILQRHTDVLKVLDSRGALDYSWKDTFQTQGRSGLERTAEEVLSHLEYLVRKYEQPHQI